MKYELASDTWCNKEIESIQNVIKSNRFTMGPMVKQFELEFKDYFGSKHAVMVNSGSSANLLAVASLFFKKNNPLKRGDEVIVPTVSWSTTYSPLQQYGLKLKFVDVNLETLNYDLDSLKTSISKKTKLVIAVNLLGNPNNYDKILKLKEKFNFYLIEDNCESMGATFNGKYTGTFGEIGTFSSFYSHHISTMEGGIITTNNEELYQLILCLRAHGWTRDLPNKNLLIKKSNLAFEESFRFILPGYNLRPLEFSGAIGIQQLKKLKSFVEIRRENALFFNKIFTNDNRFLIQKEIGESSWFGFSIILNSKFDRNIIIQHLEKNSIQVRPIVAGNFLKSESLKYYDYEAPKLTVNSDTINNFGFFVGNHHFNIKDKIQYFYNKLDEAIK